MPNVTYPRLPTIRWSKKNLYFTVGLSGSIGAGKSSARKFFSEAGGQVLDADAIAKQYLHSSQLRSQFEKHFGMQIFTPDEKSIDTSKLAEIVFTNEANRKILNSLIHPLVQKHFQKVCQKLNQGDILVYDVPLLFEGGLHKDMDLNIAVDACVTLRQKRVMERNHWSVSEFIAREKSQFSAVKKCELADLIIKNEGTLPELKQAVYTIYNAVCQASTVQLGKSI